MSRRSKPKPGYNRLRLLSLLGEEYQRLHDKHYLSAPRGVPVGGGDWMDTFFRMEAIRGTQGALERGDSIAEAIGEGKAVSSIAVRLWNAKREWQVHRWEETAHGWLEMLVHRLKKESVR